MKSIIIMILTLSFQNHFKGEIMINKNEVLEILTSRKNEALDFMKTEGINTLDIPIESVENYCIELAIIDCIDCLINRIQSLQ